MVPPLTFEHAVARFPPFRAVSMQKVVEGETALAQPPAVVGYTWYRRSETPCLPQFVKLAHQDNGIYATQPHCD